jgi:asparagine synthase (glutamine-hydrolysing)
MSYLPGDINNKVDIASMAHSLETRSPFLDHKLAELAGTIPIDHKIRITTRGIVGKYILKNTFAREIPGTIRNRRKMGFGVPIAEWFRRDLRGLARDTLTDPRTVARGYFRPEVVEDLLEGHFEGRRDNGYRLWALLMLELWHRRFVDETPAPPPHR